MLSHKEASEGKRLTSYQQRIANKMRNNAPLMRQLLRVKNLQLSNKDHQQDANNAPLIRQLLRVKN